MVGMAVLPSCALICQCLLQEVKESVVQLFDAVYRCVDLALSLPFASCQCLQVLPALAAEPKQYPLEKPSALRAKAPGGLDNLSTPFISLTLGLHFSLAALSELLMEVQPLARPVDQPADCKTAALQDTDMSRRAM